MLKWLKEKITEYTSRKFISFLITEFVMCYMVWTGRLVDGWAIVAGVLAPYIMYVFINGNIELNRIKVNTNGISINTEDAIGTDFPHDPDAGDDDPEYPQEMPQKKVEEMKMGFKK